MAAKCKESVGHMPRNDHELKSFTKAVRDAFDWQKKRGLPVARYDAATNTAYLEFADGRKEYITP